MPRSVDTTVLIIEDDRELAEQYATWLDGHETRIATDADAAYELLDRDVDVVLLDRDLPDTPSAEVLGGIRARGGDPQVGMLSGGAADGDVLRLDTDEHVPRPVTRDELRATVARLDDRKAVMEVVETYLTLVARKRSLEDRTDGEREDGEPEDDDRYREVVSELAGRRRQITGLLSRLAEPSAESPQSPGDRGDTGPDRTATGPDRTATGPDRTATGRGERGGRFPPLYLSRKSGFYGMWLVAALTYGVGDVLSTTYAVITVPGLIEGNPVVDTLLANFGLGGFLVFKLLVFLVLISISVQGARSRERFSYYWPPMVMSVLGVALTAWNLRLILGR